MHVFIEKLLSEIRDRKDESRVIFQFKGRSIKVLKWKEAKGSKKEIEGLAVEEYQDSQEEALIVEKIKDILERIKYVNEKATLIISHQKVSSRYVKLPSQDRGEIERMVNLQAGRILPYSREDIIIGYQVVDIDKEGFSCLNLVLVHKDVICTLLDMMREVGVEVDSVFLNTYGTSKLFNIARPQENEEILIVELDLPEAEVAILNKGKVCLSRFIKVSKEELGWQEKFFKQIMETQSLYLRQTSSGPIKKVFLTGSENNIEECKQILDEKMLIPVEVLSLPNKLCANISMKVEASLFGLLGFIFERPPDLLNLLPQDLKEKRRNIQWLKNRFKLIIISIVTLGIATLAFFKHIDNKRVYLASLNRQLGRIQSQAEDLVLMERRIAALEDKRRAIFKIIDVFYAIHEVIPPGIFLTEINYNSERDKEFILKGASQKVDSVFTYASNLQALDIFDKKKIKVKHATSKVTKEGELINFEIVF